MWERNGRERARCRRLNFRNAKVIGFTHTGPRRSRCDESLGCRRSEGPVIFVWPQFTTRCR